MRSRHDGVDPQLAVDRAHSLRLCGFGRHGHGDQLARRIERFSSIPDGSFVWTRDADGLFWLGRIDGPYFYDADGEDVDLVHVRPCRWRGSPIGESRCPAAVIATFERGGRNLQQIHDDRVSEESLRLWEP